MKGGNRRAVRIIAAVAALLSLAFGTPEALAYSAAGDRLFPATLVLPQFAPGDEFYNWNETLPQAPSGIGTPWHKTNITGVLSKTITDRLGIVIEEEWTELKRVKSPPFRGEQNLDAEIKYLAIDDHPHEFLMTLGLGREFGNTGAARVGAFKAGATTPRVYLAKGLGDLDIGWLRPLAVRAMFGYQVADSAPRPDLFTPGLVVEYSIPYLEAK